MSAAAALSPAENRKRRWGDAAFVEAEELSSKRRFDARRAAEWAVAQLLARYPCMADKVRRGEQRAQRHRPQLCPRRTWPVCWTPWAATWRPPSAA
jgi:hypothetical protein